MIWSCEIDYHGWEDDIQHHHFFIESDTKPTEEEVANHYNWHHFVARGNREDDEWIGQSCHIDHITPLAIASTEQEVIALCHYTNLQLLTPEDNLRKRAAYEQ